jgi:protein involved in temperature-dependent protein secretion
MVPEAWTLNALETVVTADGRKLFLTSDGRLALSR